MIEIVEDDRDQNPIPNFCEEYNKIKADSLNEVEFRVYSQIENSNKYQQEVLFTERLECIEMPGIYNTLETYSALQVPPYVESILVSLHDKSYNYGQAITPPELQTFLERHNLVDKKLVASDYYMHIDLSMFCDKYPDMYIDPYSFKSMVNDTYVNLPFSSHPENLLI